MRSILLSLKNAYATLSISAPTVVDALRGTLRREVSDARLEAWASRIVSNTEMVITVSGRANIPDASQDGPSPRKERPLLIMSNHQSHYDVAVIFYVLGSSIRMVAKRELFDVPVFGRAMREAGFISVDRQNHSSAVHSLEDARAKLESGVPIWIAPEGTRSTTGELLPFKKGGFFIAQESGATILPVTIRGTRDALPAHGLLSTRGAQVFVTIHPTIDSRAERYSSLPRKEARDLLLNDVRTAIASGL